MLGKRFVKSLPQAAKPEAVYGTKKMMTTSAATPSIRPLVSPKRWEKKSGMVIAPSFWE